MLEQNDVTHVMYNGKKKANNLIALRKKNRMYLYDYI